MTNMKISISSPVATDAVRPVAVKEHLPTRTVASSSKPKSRNPSPKPKVKKEIKSQEKKKPKHESRTYSHYPTQRPNRIFTRRERRSLQGRSESKVKIPLSPKRRKQEQIKEVIRGFFKSLFSNPEKPRPPISKERGPHPRKLGDNKSQIGFRSSFPEDLARVRNAA